MDLFSELLFARDHPDLRRFDPGESEPVPAFDCFQRLHDNVTDASIQMESGEDPPVHSSFDWIAGTAVWRRSQIHDGRSDRVLEPVTERNISHALQHLPNNPVCSPPADVAATTCCNVKSMSTVDRAALKRSSSA